VPLLPSLGSGEILSPSIVISPEGVGDGGDDDDDDDGDGDGLLELAVVSGEGGGVGTGVGAAVGHWLVCDTVISFNPHDNDDDTHSPAPDAATHQLHDLGEVMIRSVHSLQSE